MKVYIIIKKKIISGVDEAGRGSWAGPVVSAAVILKNYPNAKELKDSKILNKKDRYEIFDKLKKPPMRCALEDVPIPSTRALANLVYPSVQNILDKCQVLLGTDFAISDNELLESRDVPESAFMGPF